MLRNPADRSLWRLAVTVILIVAVVSQVIRPVFGLSAWAWWVTVGVAGLVVVATAVLQFSVTRSIARQRRDPRPRRRAH